MSRLYTSGQCNSRVKMDLLRRDRESDDFEINKTPSLKLFKYPQVIPSDARYVMLDQNT